jgi:hypothetical protein
MTDVFDLQERVSRSIVDSLSLRLSDSEERAFATPGIPDVRAFELYLRARQKIYDLTRDGLERFVEEHANDPRHTCTKGTKACQLSRPFMEPAGVEPVAARRAGPDLSYSRETPYSPRLGACVTLTVTPHGRSRCSARWARVHPANAGRQNELTSSTLIPALSLSFGFGRTWIRTSMSRALRSRSRRSMLNRASLPRTRSDTSG